MPQAVRFHRYGGIDQLVIEDVAIRRPTAGEVVVRVECAGVNPGELGILSGGMDSVAPAAFPSGQGTEFSGVVVEVAPGVTSTAPGDAVIGFSDGRDAQAELVVLSASNVLAKPAELDWAGAAIAPIAGATATAMIRAVRPVAGETVVVAGAAGGVGFAAAQLLLNAGVMVVGTAAVDDHDALRARGVHPVSYGDGVAEAIRAAAPHGVDAFLDTHGDRQADLAISLGVKPERVDSIIDFDAGQRLGIQNEGMYQLEDIRGTVIEFAELVAAGRVLLPVKARFPLERVQDAYRAISSAPGIGKVVLDIRSDAVGS
jgi:NADPH:quinone reductase-like Zn-dependent oxidoreductase